MSSKKVASKETKSKKAPAKPAAKQASKPAAKSAAKKPAAKTAAKSAAPAKKSAPAKKPVAPAKKSAPAKKPAAPVKKVAPAKKPATPAKKVAPAKKPAAPAKNTSKAAAEKKVATKAKEQVKTSAKQSPKTATKQSSKAVEKSSPATKANPSVKPESKPVSKNEEKTSAVKGKKAAAAATAKVTETVEVQAAPVEPVAEEKAADRKKNAPDYAYAVLLQGVKRLSKTIMFVKVDESEDRANKKKMSSDVKNLDMKPTSALRHKASLAEETQEELTERILKELEEQNKMFEREVATQMCTRCNRNLVSPEFWVDKHLGFCEECAAILKLGQSKEARKVEYQLGAMDGDSLDEEDDDIIGPDADDLKEAEEDLAEMDD